MRYVLDSLDKNSRLRPRVERRRNDTLIAHAQARCSLRFRRRRRGLGSRATPVTRSREPTRRPRRQAVPPPRRRKKRASTKTRASHLIATHPTHDKLAATLQVCCDQRSLLCSHTSFLLRTSISVILIVEPKCTLAAIYRYAKNLT